MRLRHVPAGAGAVVQNIDLSGLQATHAGRQESQENSKIRITGANEAKCGRLPYIDSTCFLCEVVQ